MKEDVKKGKTEGSRAVKCVSERFKVRIRNIIR